MGESQIKPSRLATTFTQIMNYPDKNINPYLRFMINWTTGDHLHWISKIYLEDLKKRDRPAKPWLSYSVMVYTEVKWVKQHPTSGKGENSWTVNWAIPGNIQQTPSRLFFFSGELALWVFENTYRLCICACYSNQYKHFEAKEKKNCHH